MKKILIPVACFFLFLLSGTCMYAQSDQPKESVVKVSLWDPVGTNGKWAKEYTNTFSFNVLYGDSKSERAFTFSGLATLVREDATGAQIAGLANIIGGDARGLAFAGLTNISENSTGAAISGLINISDDMKGLQFSGLTNISENVKGLQVTGLGNISENASGLQFAGLGNIAENVRGFQVAGLGNIAERMEGFQFAGIGNIAESVSGVQISGIGNSVQNIRGFQFGGLFNKAKNVDGVQFAGLVNIADHNDYPVGLINLVRDGEKSVGVTFDELQNLTAVFRSGGRVLYGIFGLGYNFKSSNNLMVLEGGFGAHINFAERFRVNTELTGTVMTEFDDAITRTSLRILPAYKFTRHLEIFAGPTFNYMQTGSRAYYDMFPSHNIWKDINSEGDNSQMYFGYLVGVQYVF